MDIADPLALIRPVDPDGRPAHDPCVIACLLQPTLFHARHINAQIEAKGEHTPDMTVADGWRVSGRESNAMVIGGEWTGRVLPFVERAVGGVRGRASR